MLILFIWLQNDIRNTHSNSKLDLKPVEQSKTSTLKIKVLGSNALIVSSWKMLLFYSAPSFKIYGNTLLYDYDDKHAGVLSQD